ncbi:hypothetical protein BDQ17DRAFT_1393099 [Cyathus striatus]|nr:hypothetical protein BDQ17DRAFT_1393099 [Cyathus striatus]
MNCCGLSRNKSLQGIIRRLNEKEAHINLPFAYHGINRLLSLLKHKSQQIKLHRHQASGQVHWVDHLIAMCLRQNKGSRGMFTVYIEAAKGVYHPKSFIEEEDMKVILLWQLAGNRVAEINHQASGLPSVSYLHSRSTVPPLIPSSHQPTTNEVQINLDESVHSILKVLKEVVQSAGVIHTVLMFDEIATEKQICWDPKTNNFLELCREYLHRTSIEFVNEDDVKELYRSLDNNEVHYASEATIAALRALCKNNQLYPARAVMVSGDCKQETGDEHAVIIQTVLDSVNKLQEKTKFCIMSIASDGEAHRSAALVHLTFKKILSNTSPIHRQLKFLTFLNLHVRDDDLTCDKDFKHICKRLRNLIIRECGISVNHHHITPNIIIAQLKHEGLAADHILSMFKPDDKQDVKLAYDMLKDIWSLPHSTGSLNHGFLENCEALWVLGKFAFHLVFPYLCVDLSLSEQIKHRSAATHLSLALYKQAGKEFLPMNLYIDIMIMIKNIVFCITKAKVDNPNGEFWIILLGTDHLEELFGILRTMVGNDANLDMLQLVSWLAGMTEVSNILAKYPEWDRKPCCLNLPALTCESKEILDSTDHLKPGS